MPNRAKTMNQIKEVFRLKEDCNLSVRQTAKALNISRPTVKKYLEQFQKATLDYESVKEMPDSDLMKILSEAPEKTMSKKEILSQYFPGYLIRLKQKGMTLQILWDEYKTRHSDGLMYTQFCYHFQEWRETSKLTMHIEHKAGDKMFVDFTGEKLKIFDIDKNEFREVEVFVAILGGSQLTYVEAVESQKKEDWIKVNDNALWYFGGVPRAIVPDNLKSGVSNADKYEPDVNPEYSNFAEHYGTVILPTRTYSSKDKALVEGMVKIIYTRIFVPIRNKVYYSLEELNEDIRYYLEKHNKIKFQRMNINRKELFEEIEKRELQKLPLSRYEFKEFRSLKIQFNYHIYLSEDNHYYSAPYRYRGQQAKVVYSQNTVEIYCNNQRIALHKRERNPKVRYTTLSEHMPPNHYIYAKWTPQKLISWGESKGEHVKKMVEGMLQNAKHPEQAFKSCLGLLNITKKYGNIRLNNACCRAISFDAYSYKTVKNILAKEMDKIQEEQNQKKLPSHENIRGSEYYEKNQNDYEGVNTN